ncbi:hypothetical protein DM860_011467 [Cuscuta australis]|uniref:Protein XRI1 n=1 Tax=Cuscuta australis TaxID=267555 RepID=A0A328DQF5_9ASTE|nr:hypothetical protein DM860_011467 [Cuscuta australis]
MDNLQYSIAPTSSPGGGWGLRHIAASCSFPSPGTENTPPCKWPDVDDSGDACTGYLQDALFNFNTKRRRLLLFGDDDDDPAGNCKDLNVLWNITKLDYDDDDDDDYGQNIKVQHSYENWDDSIPFPEMKSNRSEEEEEEAASDSRKFYHSNNNKHTPPSFSAGSDGGGDRRPTEKALAKLAYPFAVVKPGGTEGDLTLDEINERILMPPTRPVKHPVGDFACRPLVSPDGPGLSGKAVVALTRIQTRGRGTITIIRTRG